MSVEVVPLPVFVTEQGELVDVPDILPDLGNGFVFDERECGEPVDGIHLLHVNIASVLLRETGVIQREPIVVPEFVQHAQEYTYSPPHLDGLVGRYYQVHTTHHSDQGQHSSVVLSSYDLSSEEHECLMVLHASGFGETSGHGVEFHPPVPGMFFGAIAPIVANRAPQSRWSGQTAPNSTVVFPNGYDARPGSTPAELYVHHFSTVEIDDHEGPRTLSLSRLEY